MPKKRRKLRSEAWFNDKKNPVSTAIHLERYMNSGMSIAELRSGRPIIGIAQSGSDLTPCNRHHVDLAKRTKEGIRDAGGIPIEFPIHPIHESGRRPTAALDRNLAFIALIEILHGYPLDGVILNTGCDKTTPAMLMAAIALDMPSIVLSGGPMLNGYVNGERKGAGTTIWSGRNRLNSDEISFNDFLEEVISSAPSPGHCNTMGTALTMNAIAEALGMSLPGCAAIPAPHRERGEVAFLTGKRAVDLVHEDLRPSKILSDASFRNAIRVCLAIGGSTNAVVHLSAIAEIAEKKCTLETWDEIGKKAKLLTNCQPAGEYLGEDFFRAGGVPAVIAELIKDQNFDGHAKTVNGQTMSEMHSNGGTKENNVIRAASNAPEIDAQFIVMSGNFFTSAIFKASVVDDFFKEKYLQKPGSPNRFTARAIVFDGPEDYHHRINLPDLDIDENCILVMRGCGPVGYPGSAEVVNMPPPDRLIQKGINVLPCLGDGRQSGTSASPSILHVSPEAAVGGDILLLKTNDTIEVDFGNKTVNVLISDDEFEKRRNAIEIPQTKNQTPWQEIYRKTVTQLEDGAGLNLKYNKILTKSSIPRHSH